MNTPHPTRVAAGKKAAEVLIARDPLHYVKIGAKGGEVKVATKGFGNPNVDGKAASRKGGIMSGKARRAKKLSAIQADAGVV